MRSGLYVGAGEGSKIHFAASTVLALSHLLAQGDRILRFANVGFVSCLTTGVQSNESKIFFQKNTMDLQWKMRADYNASPCAGSRKPASARTMENNEKNNGKNN